jgi:hypothetical protein
MELGPVPMQRLNRFTSWIRWTSAVLAVWLVAVPAARSAASVDTDPVSLIQQDYRRGTISFDAMAIMTAQAIRNPSALPRAYQRAVTSTAEPYVTRGVTMALRDIRVNWNQLSDSAQRIVQNILTRWSTAFTYVSPGGFFKFHFDTTGTNSVPPADADLDGIPDFVEKCGSYCDSSLNRQLGLGYVAPPSDGTAGGDSKYDVYFENMSYYGYTQPEVAGPQPWNDYTSYLVLHRNFLGFPTNTDPEGNQAGAAKVTCAHELHHAIQFAYNVFQPNWYMEMDATAMETVVFPHTNDNYNYLSSFFGSPETSLMDNSIHEYACFIWGLYLIQKFDTSLTVAAWQGGRYADIYATISDTMMARYGWSQDSAFADFAVWCYCTGSRNDGLHFSDAAHYPLATIARSHSAYPVSTQTSPTGPAGYAASYIQFVSNGSTGKLRITFDGDNARDWAAFAIKASAGNVYQVQKMILDPTTSVGTIDVYGFENSTSVTLVAVNLSENSSSANFTYSAQVLQPYQITTKVLTDSALYSGTTRLFSYRAKNPSNVDEIVRVRWHDDLHWGVSDSLSKYLVGGDSVTVTFSLKPPKGTPNGAVSVLHLDAVCLNDLSVTVSDSVNETTVVHRGDLNFDGIVDSGDLAYLVAYLNGGGISPIPEMEAGNFNCQGIVDLGDLAALVSYLTGGGYRCLCNPF